MPIRKKHDASLNPADSVTHKELLEEALLFCDDFCEKSSFNRSEFHMALFLLATTKLCSLIELFKVLFKCIRVCMSIYAAYWTDAICLTKRHAQSEMGLFRSSFGGKDMDTHTSQPFPNTPPLQSHPIQDDSFSRSCSASTNTLQSSLHALHCVITYFCRLAKWIRSNI